MSETILYLRSEIRRLEDDKERQQIQYNDQCVAREITVIFSLAKAVRDFRAHETMPQLQREITVRPGNGLPQSGANHFEIETWRDKR